VPGSGPARERHLENSIVCDTPDNAHVLRRLTWIVAFERFSFGTMIALLALYLIAPQSRGGLDWNEGKAILIAGFVSGIIPLTVPVGGLILDRWPRHSKLIGTVGISSTICGLFAMVILARMNMTGSASPSVETGLLWLGISAVSIGNGLFKPSIALAVSHGGINPLAGRDSSFTRFWYGIQAGVFGSILLAGTLADYFDWVTAFGATMLGPAIAIILWHRTKIDFHTDFHMETSVVNEAINMERTDDDKSSLFVVLLVCVMFALYYAGLSQVFGLLSVLFETQADRDVLGFTVPTAWISAAETAIILVLTPLIAAFWSRCHVQGREPNSLAKFALGMIFLAVGFLLLGLGIFTMERIPLTLCILVVMLIGVSEIPLQPIGLSLVSGLASTRLKGRAIGLWYAGSAAGGFIAGLVGTATNRSDPAPVLLILGGLFGGCAILLWYASRRFAVLLATRSN
jgi:proton-dependent oligopeptide transporter, POT family